MRRVSLTLLAFVLVLVMLVGARYQWARSHRLHRRAITTARQDSLRRDSATSGVNEPADTMCLASRIGFPCDAGASPR